ncbi:elongation factor P maturation arginine rhamnosyltransferase EarP [Plesiomonas shigelloides]|uniref:elongation factor P maturation arginine rhamnosyltransferase EarP n=1 Tax=Plesiomonas shigelloides TaxID=703 RepID=UPI00177BFEAB|nr:elongation factor P maturation arginine rhamnosyltransferase EarP [Plesiomonas shigelloides]QOH78574.1 elongation factor P maturation arginine rhamnosyltransferase EarP [Plesiomonas shigelloides]
MTATRYDWDIFCTVVDNFGDIGVTLRLARQLAHDYQQQVRLWVDDLQSTARICPGLDATLASQMYDGVNICRWDTPFTTQVTPAHRVIEAFACELPPEFRQQMKALSPAPLWLNLEYLSAEEWVEGCHRLPSWQPDGLTKYFFFPGFTPATGGLLREQGLFAARDQWRGSAEESAYWAELGIPVGQRQQEIWISLFTYENPALFTLLEAWEQSPDPIRLWVPQGRTLDYIAARYSQVPPKAGDCWQRGNLSLQVLPFTDQRGFDRLLWSCDFNFIRGEDSFVRAQWAAVPVIWHIYPQEEEAHMEKLDAFLERYLASWDEASADLMRRFSRGYNQGKISASDWNSLFIQRELLKKNAIEWADLLAETEDLACQLVNFSESS